jgi:putative nucleotidyltransferase with HDIG domain
MATALKALGKVEDWHAQDVPPFPTIALKALNLMAGTDTSLFQLCNLVRPDAAFSAEVIRIANSPPVAFPKNVTNILQASMVLGFRRLRGVIITVGLRSYLAGKFTPVLHSCWRHSVATGMIAERIAAAHFRDKDFAYTAGILHDIGRIAMAVGSPALYEQVRILGADQPRELLETERALYGIDHCHAGARLAKSWHLPDAFLKIITHHHDFEAQTGDEVASIVAVSCLLAEALGFGIARYRKPLSYENLPNSVRNLRGVPADREDIASELEREIQLIESV